MKTPKPGANIYNNKEQQTTRLNNGVHIHRPQQGTGGRQYKERGNKPCEGQVRQKGRAGKHRSTFAETQEKVNKKAKRRK